MGQCRPEKVRTGIADRKSVLKVNPLLFYRKGTPSALNSGRLDGDDMAKISIEPERARTAITQEEALEKTLRALGQNVDSIRNGLRYKIAGREAIAARLREAAEQLYKEADSTRNARNGLEQIINLYVQTEKANLDRVAAEKTSIQQGAGAGGASTAPTAEDGRYKYVDPKWSKLWSLIGPAAVIPNILMTDKHWPSVTNEVVKTLGKIAKTVLDSPRAEWAKKLFGFNIVTEASSFLENLGDFSTLGKGLGTVVDWGTSIVDSFLKNVKEFGNDSWTTGRFWAESGIEAGIKIVEKAGFATLIGTGLIAAFGSAPAVVIGGVTTLTTLLVDWGLDNLVSWATNGSETSWIEFVSDGICNAGEWLKDNVGPVVQKTVDGAKRAVEKGVEVVKDGVNTAIEGGKKVLNYIGDFFSGCRWGKRCVSGGGAW